MRDSISQFAWRALGLVAVACIAVLLGCGGSGVSMSNTVAGSGSGSNAQIPAVQHVVIVVLENANYSDVVGSANAPYLNSLIAKGGLASNYYANMHPSIGNYLVMTTGQAYTNDDLYLGTVPIDNVVRQLTAVSKSWKAYAEDLPFTGYIGPDIPLFYYRNHNPLTYFTDVLQSPMELLNIVPFAQLATDLASSQLPAYSFIVPNALHDAHSCSDGLIDCDISVRISNADQWLSQNLPSILQNSQFQQSGILVITFDESASDNTNGGGKVMTLLLGTRVKAGYVATGTYDHRSLLGLSMTALGANIPNGANSANAMTEFFQ